MIDVASLTSLRAIETHGSVSAAAAALGFTPSAISQQVKRLERDIGAALLERVGRGVVLTGRGRHLAREGGLLLAHLEELEAGLHRHGGDAAGELRIAAFSTATRGLIAPAVKAAATAHPDLVLTITEREPWDAIDLVARGGTDIAVVHNWGDIPLDIPGHLVRTTITTDIADVVMLAEHPLAHNSSVSPAELLSEGWIATPEGTICRQWLRRMHDGTGQLPRIAHESMEFDSQIALVAAGLGIALIPRLGRHPLPSGVVAVPTIDPVSSRTITALHRHSMAASPAVDVVLAALSAAAHKKEGPAEAGPSIHKI
ncbi:DNA-binding transcriptional LysR family regulator [Homoserinimonas aerilata]|uniref:DNA-binding transcriptional LysR family regulator n=1 Tax=Homoserinimonas aerilata TaxID=1162970 RepID=A0A542YL83_9MICO|nr:LysR family transcriptional regulator [Homoserinimonas aerilata]TQL48862.1 DNA-binding transcriptional LysR family regulator [Homoserinimonas aerilata]